MRTILSFLLVILGSSSLLVPVMSQSPEDLYRTWRAGQETALENVRQVSLQEESMWTLDAPSGQRVIEWTARLTGDPERRGWDRAVRSVFLNGEERPVEDLERAQASLEMLTRIDEQALGTLISVPPRILGLLRPTTGLVETTLDDVPVYRFEALPRRPLLQRPMRSNRPPPSRRRNGPPPQQRPSPVERVTVWFSNEPSPQLLQIRLVISPPREGSSIVVTSQYVRSRGLDLIATRTLEGQIRQQRRLRTFTFLMEARTTFSDYQVTTD